MPLINRFIVEALQELCSARHISFESWSQGWILRLSREERVSHVYGYNFELNSASASLIANDKAALSALLDRAALPHVEHQLFLNPELSGFTTEQGNWPAVLEYAQTQDFNLICKTNQGSGGNGVFRVQNQRELECSYQRLFESHRSISLSPFYPIKNEYRFIVLEDRVLLAYEKVIASVSGDGKRTFEQLVLDECAAGNISTQLLIESLEDLPVDRTYIPPRDEQVRIRWKHNLGNGATAKILPPHAIRQAKDLALLGIQACGLKLAAVDVIYSQDEYKILEINCGIMLENLARNTTTGYQRAKQVYGAILDTLFSSKDV